MINLQKTLNKDIVYGGEYHLCDNDKTFEEVINKNSDQKSQMKLSNLYGNEI